MAKKKLSYSEAMAEVESIIARMRSGELAIDELSSATRRATELIEQCRKELTAAEEDVEKLINPNS
ncbi:MAG: exodeoxyribonuclease VII small subunit [Alistipes sp.]|nr:exodeoxyribonuclease VII small subunit [Alistipes sp.]